MSWRRRRWWDFSTGESGATALTSVSEKHNKSLLRGPGRSSFVHTPLETRTPVSDRLHAPALAAADTSPTGSPDLVLIPWSSPTTFTHLLAGGEPLDRRLASPPPLWGRDRVGGRADLSFGRETAPNLRSSAQPPSSPRVKPGGFPHKGEEAARRPPGMAAGSRERCANHVGSSPGMPKGAPLNANVAAPRGDGRPLATL